MAAKQSTPQAPRYKSIAKTFDKHVEDYICAHYKVKIRASLYKYGY